MLKLKKKKKEANLIFWTILVHLNIQRSDSCGVTRLLAHRNKTTDASLCVRLKPSTQHILYAEWVM